MAVKYQKRVTILFLLKEGQILLAMKKRGLGQGKWNGVGGKIEKNETPEQAASRECQEEIGVYVDPKDLIKLGELEFLIPSQQFESYDYIFTATKWIGTIVETEEMAPKWFSVKEIPYDQMWSADYIWLPKIIAGEKIKGRITFDEQEKIQKATIIDWTS